MYLFSLSNRFLLFFCVLDDNDDDDDWGELDSCNNNIGSTCGCLDDDIGVGGGGFSSLISKVESIPTNEFCLFDKKKLINQILFQI